MQLCEAHFQSSSGGEDGQIPPSLRAELYGLHDNIRLFMEGLDGVDIDFDEKINIVKRKWQQRQKEYIPDGNNCGM